MESQVSCNEKNIEFFNELQKDCNFRRNILRYKNRFDEYMMIKHIEKAVDPKEKNEGIVKKLRDIAIKILKESLTKM